MARINIEDSLFKDARFIDLCIFYGDKTKALGAVVWAFMVAQKFYLSQESDRLIPLSEWNQQGCDNKLIDLGFAEKRNDLIYVKGSEKQFAWLVQRVEAGRKGGNSIKSNKNSNIKKKTKEAVAKRSLSEEKQTEANESLLSLTPSLSPTLTLTQAQTPKSLAETTSVRRMYEESYFSRYGLKPVWAAKESTLAKKLIASIGKDEAEQLAKAYPFFNDPWHVKQKHPFGLLVSQLDKVRVELANPERMMDEKRASRELSDYELKRNNLRALGLEE